jgi:hypothetical protein
MLVKIKDRVFVFKNEQIQYDNMGTQITTSISFTFDIISNNNYKKFFVDLWDNQSLISSKNTFTSSYKIDLFTSRYKAIGCFIKMIDMSDTEIKLSFSCDLYQEISLQERRDIVLNKLLD